jgi:hypothetical protein
VVVFSSLSVLSQEVSYTASELAKLRGVFWNSVTDIDMEYSEEIFFAGESMVKLPTSRWSKDVNRERIVYYAEMIPTAVSASRNVNDVRDFKKKPLFYKKDVYFEHGKFYVMNLRDSNRDSILEIPKFSSVFDFKKSGLSVEVFGRKPGDFTRVCPADSWLIFRQFNMTFGSVVETPHTFEYFVDNKCRTATPIRSKNKIGDSIWTFTMHSKSDNDNKMFIEVTINESKSFFLEKVTSHTIDLVGQEVLVDYIMEEYMEIEPECFFPKTVVYQYYIAGKKPENFYKKIYRIESVSINKPIADAVFDFRIPEYTIVRNQPSVEKDGKRFFVESIWGADNKPIITFHEDGALDEYLNNQYHSRHNGQGRISTNIPLWRVILCLMGVSFLLLSLFFTIRKGKHRK